MKYAVSLILVFTLFVGQIKAQEDAAGGYTLQECIDYALKNNQNLINKAYDKEIAETQVGETLSRGLPQVNIEAGVNYNFEPQKSLLPARMLDPNAPEGREVEFSFQQKYDGNVGLKLSQLIFDGSFFVGLEAAKTYKELSTKEYIKTEIDVIEAVSKAYYNALVTEERYELLRANLARLDTLLNDTKVMYDNGFAEKIDVSRLKVQHNNLKVQVDNTAKLLELSEDLLQFQMGMHVSEEITLTDKLEEVAFSDPSIDEDFSYNERIEYSQLQTNMALANLDLKNNKVQYIPTLYANFNYGYNTQTSQSDQLFKSNRWLNYGTTGLSLNIPVFDGLLKSNRIQKNKIQIRQIEQTFEQLENSIDLEIKQAKVNMVNAMEQMRAQRENMDLAEEIYNVTKIKYQEGVGSNLEVVEADTDYKESQTNYYNALYEALVAKVELDKAYGQLKNK
ncbi:outer membrane efflux protein [Fulvivirga imtechensis AK7]|uniref:Outer membrane efflux protein n=1 Tax=Fulvivirga imtechensis AK7 TaxID=1237149 RepID=L8JTP3_9BACT|nr:TolC family protein [Fulvivirga imtechensis]ELR72356.1 outer membrane efflux protein [Fulvivirga imtechensis AK7]